MRKQIALLAAVLSLGLVDVASANVLNMGGARDAQGHWTGLASLELVPVGDVGNADGTYSYPCGRVDYAYNIGKYEVTAGQYTEFLNAVARTDTYGLYSTSMWSNTYGCKINRSGPSGSYTYSVAADYANRPVNYVSFGDAMRFANWLQNGQPTTGFQDASTTEDGAYFVNGATTNAAFMAVARKVSWQWAVTSEDEWYKAAYYKGGSTNAGYWLYATSSSSMPGRDMNDALGNNANYLVYNGGYVIGGPYYRTVVGEFQNSHSPYGTFDQCGNVDEWNEASLYASYRVHRGGSFNSMYISDIRSDGRNGTGPVLLPPTFEDGILGFRVSQVPEPASIGLLGLGVMGLLARRGGTRG